MWIVLAAVVGLVAGVGLWTFRYAPRHGDPELQKYATGAQILASVFTALGIGTAGLLYLLEQQWSPRFDVSLNTSSMAVPKSDPAIALVHLVVSIKNDSRTAQTINGIELGAVGLKPMKGSKIDAFGDLPGTYVLQSRSTRSKRIEAGETDYAFAEITIPCEYSVARIIVKIPRPPFSSDTPIGKRMVYQRKALVPLTAVCPRAPNQNLRPRK